MSERTTTRPPLDPRLVAFLMRLQFQINCVSSVAIEYPALRPARLDGGTSPLLGRSSRACQSHVWKRGG